MCSGGRRFADCKVSLRAFVPSRRNELGRGSGVPQLGGSIGHSFQFGRTSTRLPPHLPCVNEKREAFEQLAQLIEPIVNRPNAMWCRCARLSSGRIL